MTALIPDTDVFIVGGGPAGLAAAIAARQRGLSVTLADGTMPPIDKACGEGLMPVGVAALEAMGARALIPTDSCTPLTGVRYVQEDGMRVEARFGGASGLGVRRVLASPPQAAPQDRPQKDQADNAGKEQEGTNQGRTRCAPGGI